ncbi:MAG: ribonuclease HII [Sphaerochaetaceae bacterium]|nr:ribonuclease HII [Sphaerochaetaceae bacterium]
MSYVCGIDEAGRGPLAGPVCAAAVILPPDFPVDILDDSKRLSPKRRMQLEQLIRERAVAWNVAYSSHTLIDRINILQATLDAMRRSYEGLVRRGCVIEQVVVDGNRVFSCPHPIEAVVRGDSTVPAIMAASILAKNHRDRIMMILDDRYPEWEFASHKGYPTRAHAALCSIHGLSPVHRRSFRIPSHH